MALNNVLSALREIILDTPEIPADKDSRRAVFSSRFPLLSTDELHDLLEIEPDKFKIYTTSIFQAEKGILRTHFPITFALLNRAWPEVFKEKFNGYEFVEKLHSEYPWQSTLTTELGRNFCGWIRNKGDILVQAFPVLPEIAELELKTIELKRAVEELPKGFRVLSQEQIVQLSVADLLNSSLILSKSARIVEGHHDLATFYRNFYAAGKKLPELPLTQNGGVYTLGARAHDLSPRWIGISAGVYQFFKKHEQGRTVSFSELVSVVVEELPEEMTEEGAFARVLGVFSELREIGSLLLVVSA